MALKVSCFLFALFHFSSEFYLSSPPTLTKSCVKCHETDPEKINVHLIHHSHDDVGWLKTVDQYYWGLNYSIQHVGVQYIMTSVANALADYPDRRFIQVETAFFWKWWENQDDVMRAKFRNLVENGQIEIVNGAWSMNDEACVNYQSTIDQFTWAFKVLNDTLGECGTPTIAWQIDPFGHSKEHGSLMAKMGFDGLFFGRLDFNDREVRKAAKTMDFLWKTSANNEEEVIFGSVFGSDNTYHTPSGLCFDILCSDDSINDNPQDGGFNLKQKMEEFAAIIKTYASYYKTNNVIITMGGDFYYQAAEINFRNSDKLIKGFQNHSDIKVIYSTPSCYVQSIYDSQPEFDTKTDDFFPYASSGHTYWTGYFTSRQNFKRFERVTHNILQSAKQLNSFAQIGEEDSIRKLKEVSGVVQHHDAITGTEKQHVTNDYLKMMYEAVQEAEVPFTDLIRTLSGNNDIPQLTSCLLSNVSICPVTQNSSHFLVVLYNPLSWPVDYVVRLPVESDSFTVQGPTGEVAHDVVNPISEFSYVKIDGLQPGKYELVFLASQIPALGIHSYTVTKSPASPKIATPRQDSLKFGDETLGFELDSDTNLLKSVTINELTINVTQHFWYYLSRVAIDNHVASGAYIFQPDGFAKGFENPTITQIFHGEVVEEVKQKFNDWITQIIRIYKNSTALNYIEFDWLVGPVDVSDNNGKEIITKFTVPEFNTNSTFYTDSNGREMIERILNYRPTFAYDHTEVPVTSNYYPVTSRITIRNNDLLGQQLSVLNDRSQGGSSLEEGELELMISRRMLKDDAKGVGEALNEQEFGQGVVARGQHYLIAGSLNQVLSKSVKAQERIVAQHKLLQPWVGVANLESLGTDIVVTYSALKTALPESVNIVTLEPWNDSRYLLRLEHILEKNDDAVLSVPVIIDLKELFADFIVENVVETTLGANRPLATFSTYSWTYDGKSKKAPTAVGAQVELSPMDIKTFIVSLTKRSGA